MGKLRDLMDRDLTIRGYADGTRDNYLRAVEQLARYFKKSPDLLTIEDINQYQLHLTRDLKVSWSYFNVAVAGIRFFYSITLQKDWELKLLPYRKTGTKLPEVPSEEEIVRLFSVIHEPKDRSIYMIAYGVGLRSGEIRHLRVTDIDSSRRVIRVQQAKGRKDRYVPLPEPLLPMLREYWTMYRPKTWLFTGRYDNAPISAGQVQDRLRYYLVKAGLSKRITPHTLRHAFATHSLEQGGNIRVIQEILGHRSLRTTEKYTHVAKTYLQNAKSPLETVLGATPPKGSEPKP